MAEGSARGRGDLERVLVLGAGIQGVCCALALASTGRRVTIVDAADDCMLRASLRQEGKVHLGFVYANDPTRRSAELMLDGALRFGPLLEAWTRRPIAWHSLRSRPFTYVVVHDTMVPAMSLFERYADLEAHYNAVARETNGDRYVGETPTRLWTVTEPGSYGSLLRPDQVAGTVDTAEVALDTRALRGILRDALHGHPLVTAEYGCSVHEATRAGNGFRVSGTRGEEPWAAEAGVVVNCLWTSRLQLDAQLGLAPERPCVHRLKYRVLGRLPADLAGMPSLSFVLGPYGDVVVQPGSPAYLSWYPSCATETAHALGSPAAWQPACAGSPDLAMADEIARATVRGLAELVPSLAGFEIEHVDAGVIVAWGSTDITDPDSELHRRHEIGVASNDGWFSIDTGKFTTAPLFASQVERAL